MRKIKTSIKGYKKNSPDNKEPALIIPSGKITMKNVPYPVFGMDELGNGMMMFPGQDYEFPGNQVTEVPLVQLQAGGTIPNAGSPYDLLSEYDTARYSLENAKNLKLAKNGNFKGLVPLEYWSDDLMNYVDKIKFVTRNKEKFAKVRGKLFPPSEFQEEPQEQKTLKKGGLTPNKAREILHDKKVHGKPLTEKQRKFFGAMSKGNTMKYEHGGDMEECINEMESMLKMMKMHKNKNMQFGGSPIEDRDALLQAGNTVRSWVNELLGNNMEAGGEMKKGGIHIKPENRGKFTASAKAAGMGVQEFARHVLANKDKYSSTQVKRANFARNAAKWHQFGGDGPEIPQNETTQFDEFGYPTFPATPIRPAGMMRSSYPANGINPEMFSNLSPAADAASGKLKIKDPNKKGAQSNISLNPLGALNLFNLGLTRLGESLRNKELEEYTRQMQLLMNQPATTILTKEQQYGNPMNAQIGGVIPEDLTYLSLPIGINIPSGISQRVSSGVASRISSNDVPVQQMSLSPEFSGYAEKANKYLKSKGFKTDVSGEMLASGAQQAYTKYGKMVPVELALAQMQLEGYLAPGNKPNIPQRTKNPFNVGNTDTGATITHSNVQNGINAYFDLIARSYLKDKTPQQLLENFTNSKGNRYASAKNYESGLKSIISTMKFRKGGIYEVDENQIENLRKQGYEFEEI